MKWERPEFVEIAMNAEIGGYQSDFDDEVPGRPTGPVVYLVAYPRDTRSSASQDETSAASDS